MLMLMNTAEADASSCVEPGLSARPEVVGRVVRVLGIGNVLLGDDGFGPFAVRTLEAEYETSEAVEVLDAGTPGLDLTPFLADARAVIILDTVRSDAAPGTLRTYDLDQLLSTPPLPRTSPHEPGLREALLATELVGRTPDSVLLIGVVPASTATGTGLGPEVRSAVPAALELAVTELVRLDVPPARRDPPLEPDIWWERSGPLES